MALEHYVETAVFRCDEIPYRKSLDFESLKKKMLRYNVESMHC